MGKEHTQAIENDIGPLRGCKSNMASNMAANTSIYSTVRSNLMIFVSILSFLGTINTFRLNEYLYPVGNKIIEDMIGKSAFNYKFKWKDRAKTLGNMSAVNIAPDCTNDPALLFQRFFVVSRSGDLSLGEVLSYKLSPFPPALFEARNVHRKADKPQLAQAIRYHATDLSSEAVMNPLPETDCYVLDGGSLLHRLPWKTGDSYGAIAACYADFTVRRYCQATVAFDGYGEGPSIMDSTHQRRGKSMHPIVSFTAETEFSGKKEDFLSRDENKADMIALISTALTERGYHVSHQGIRTSISLRQLLNVPVFAPQCWLARIQIC